MSQKPNTSPLPSTEAEQAIASQVAFDRFAGVYGQPTPIDQRLIEHDRNMLDGPPRFDTLRKGSVAVAHAVENSVNPNSIRSSKQYEDRQRHEREAGRLLPR